MKFRKILLFAVLTACVMQTKAEWIDVTDYYLSNPRFDNNQTSGWTWTSNASSQKADYDCFEFWNGTFDMWQNLDLTKGHYRLSFQGYYRCGDYGAIYDAYRSGSEEITAFVYFRESATEKMVRQPVTSAFSYSFDQNVYDCWTNDDQHYYPNNMAAAVSAFANGWYENTLEFDVEEDGAVQIGLICESQLPSNWCIFDNFKLEFDGQLTMATGIKAQANKTEIMVGQTASCWAEITPENATSKKVTWTSSNINVAAVNEDGLVSGVGAGTVSITATTTDGTNLSASVQITVKDYDNVNWVDVTSLFVTNPNFDDDSTEGWTWNSNASSQKAEFGCFEFWNGNFQMEQELKGLPPGPYRVSVQGYYRTGDNNDAYNAYLDGRDVVDANLSVYNNNWEMFMVPLKNIYSWSFAENVDGCWSPGWFSNEYYPNNMASASEAFKQGSYLNSLIFEAEDRAIINISNTSAKNSNWCIFDNFKLEFGGEFVKVSGIKMSIAKDEIIESETTQCTAVVMPENALFKKVTWKSSNEKVAKVDENGLVTGVGVGMALITATATDGSGANGSVVVKVVANNISSPNDLVINEIMAANVDEFVSLAFNFDGWVELYNPTANPIRLGQLYLSDDASNLKLWHMPDGVGVVPANGYKVVWLGSNDVSSLCAPFELDVDGGTIYLSDENGKLIASQTYPQSFERVSYARIQDGGDEWGFASEPTPGKSNTGSRYATSQLAAPVVDTPSKLFTGQLTVNVTIPSGCILRYTTNGSLPTMTNGNTSTTGQFKVLGTMSYRFRLFANGMLPSRVTTRSYIFKETDYPLPIISVVSDQRFLYGDSLGVLVRGVNGRPGNGQASKCNWNMDWDRPVNFSYLTPDGEMVLNQDVNLEMCGGWSRAWSPHAFKLKGSKEMGGDKNLPYPFFEDKPYIRNRTLQVRNGGNDTSCRFKDPALQYIAQTSGLNIECQSYQPVHEFINGQYIGVLNIREPNNKHYVYANYGWDDEEIDQFEMSPDSGYVQKCGTDESFLELVDQLSVDAANSETYREICQLLDIDEYINYMATEFYLCNWDWPQNNVKGFRKQDGGKFRFVLFDLDGSFNSGDPFSTFMGKENYTFDQLYPTSLGRKRAQIRFVTLFRNLLNNADFRKKFIDSFCIMGGSVYEVNRALDIIDKLANRANPAMRIEGGSVNSTANQLRNNLQSKMEQSTSALRSYSTFGLNRTEAQRVKLSSDVDNAQLMLNGMQVPTGQFNGRLFQPVTLRALAPGGYAFQGWLKDGGSSTIVVESGSTWKYYDQGSLDGVNWTSPSYNENEWKSGRAPLGYEKEGIRTTLEYGNQNNKRPTAYFRKAINLDKGPGAKDQIQFKFTIDDGFIVYVNGSEAGRYNMPSGNVSYNTFASSYAPSNPDQGTISLSPDLFHSGSNLIAVEVHNNSATSTDLMWDASLSITFNTQQKVFYSTEPEINLPDGDVTLVASYRPLTEVEMKDLNIHPISVNEVSASNDCYINEYGKKNDWVELYNATDKEVDVEGMYLTNDLTNPTLYRITKGNTQANTKIAPHGYLLIWCDKLETTNSALHAPFKISGEGIIALMAADRSWADVLYYEAHDGNSTVGRFPDGAKDIYLMDVPTIEKPNIHTSYMTEVDQTNSVRKSDLAISSANGFRIYYGSQHLFLRSEETGMATVNIFTTDGRLVETETVRLINGTARLDISHLAPGFYVARAVNDQHTQVACKLMK
ncbi:MAG: CotH kinase family protein [Prevotella sp.]|nr:CotH kinase family protein [Prevotella sp.]